MLIYESNRWLVLTQINTKTPPNYLKMADAEQEETIIRHYFSLNYDYNTILSFLERNHGIKISKRTLLNRLNTVAHWQYSNYCWITETDPLARSVRIVQ
jgi:hypothetical protein